MECDFGEKAESGYSSDDGAGSQFLIVRKVALMGANVL
jgi:hypothetical protein